MEPGIDNMKPGVDIFVSPSRQEVQNLGIKLWQSYREHYEYEHFDSLH